MINFDLRKYMIQAYKAAQESKDPSTQNGAVILNQDGQVSWGFNSINPRWPQEYVDRKEKYKWVTHAERSAICTAAKHGHKTSGAIMISPWSACRQCAIAIADCGITHLIMHQQRMDLGSTWDVEVKESLNRLKLAKVTLLFLDMDLPEAPSILVSGEKWQP